MADPYRSWSEVKIEVSDSPALTRRSISWRTAIDDVALLWATDNPSQAGQRTIDWRWAMRRSVGDVVALVATMVPKTTTKAANQNRNVLAILVMSQFRSVRPLVEPTLSPRRRLRQYGPGDQ